MLHLPQLWVESNRSPWANECMWYFLEQNLVQVITYGIFLVFFLCRRCQWKKGSRMITNPWLPTVWQVSVFFSFLCVSPFLFYPKRNISFLKESQQPLFPSQRVLWDVLWIHPINVLPAFSETMRCNITRNVIGGNDKSLWNPRSSGLGYCTPDTFILHIPLRSI